MKSSSDIIIIGGGIIGCAIANRLAAEGLNITIIEKGEPGREASWAAAGMLAPHAEAAHSVPSVSSNLMQASHALYPDFVAELEEETGIQIGYQVGGSLVVATDYREATMLAGLLERQLAVDRPAEEFTAQQVHDMQPGLAESVQSALFFQHDHYVNNRRLMKALVASARKHGVQFRTMTPVIGLECEQSRISGVLTPDGLQEADVVVNAAGAWAGTLDPSSNIRLSVRPIRGQIVQVQVQPQMLNQLIHSSGCYIVPWPDGRTLIGSTLENVGFDNSVTAAGVQALLSAAIKIVPALKEAVVKDMWAGLRPDTSDNLPILGCTAIQNYIIATGHFRNGVLLAPITARLISELVLSGQPSIPLAPFSAARFSADP